MHAVHPRTIAADAKTVVAEEDVVDAVPLLQQESQLPKVYVRVFIFLFERVERVAVEINKQVKKEIIIK